MTNPNTAMIQSGLAGLGYDPGPVDGLCGAKTLAAGAGWLAAKGAPCLMLAEPATTSVIYQGSARYPISEIAVHCSDTRPDWMGSQTLFTQKTEVRRWHMEDRGWKDIGYHWLIGRSGDVLAGRAETVIGAGIEGHNRGVIHICLIGGHGSAETDAFTRHFTAAQGVTLRQMIQGVSMRTRITRISGHNEWAAKACPGFNVPKFMKEAA